MSLGLKRMIWGGAAVVMAVSAASDFRSGGRTWQFALEVVAVLCFAGVAFTVKGG